MIVTPLFLLLLSAVPDEDALCRDARPDEPAIVEKVERDDGLRGVWACGHIAAAPQRVYDALIDYESYPDWIDKVGATEVQWTSPVTALVDYRLDIIWGEFSYVLERTHEEPLRIDWTMSEGDWDAVEGYYHFHTTEDGHTLLFMQQFIDPGRYVPGFIERYFQQKASRQLIEDIRAETIRREALRADAALEAEQAGASDQGNQTVEPAAQEQGVEQEQAAKGDAEETDSEAGDQE